MKTLFSACLGAGLLFCAGASAQIVTGSVAGTVNDPSGLPVPGAQVTLVQGETGKERKAQTNERGDFVISGLDAGRYRLSITAAGFKKLELQEIQLPTGERVPLGALQLDVGQVTETVSVTGQASIVQVQTAERADVITSAQVENLAIRGRNVQDLMSLLPGVVTGNPQEGLSSSSSINVQGARSTMNNISVDGAPATDMGNGSQLKVTVSQDAVSEVKMLVSNYSAEYGRMAGSNIQIVTKSGTREFHGLVSWFKRHEQFNANSLFNNQQGLPKGRYRYNTYTYNMGGPVLIPGAGFNRSRDKLFFFFHQEFWPTQGVSGGQVTVPTALERQGNFSQTVDVNNRAITVRDPYNGNSPFPGNIIPQNRVNPNGLALLKFFPEPNFLDRNVSRGQYNYVFQDPNSTPKRTNTLKVDYNLNQNNTLVFGYSVFKDVSEGAFGTTTAAGNWPIMRKNWTSTGKSTTARYTRILSPSVLNEFSFGWLDQPADNFYKESELKKMQRDTAGFQIGQFTPSANPLKILPNATFGGIPGAANIQTEGRFPLYNRYHLVNFSDNLTIMRGGHNLKFGTYIETFYRNQKKSVNFVGTFNFANSATNPLDTGYAYGNAALGVFNTYSEISGEAWMKVRTGGCEFFAQDNWKASRKLTLDYGLRMYVLQPIWEMDNFMAGFVPQRYDPSKPARLIEPGFDAQRTRVGVNPVNGRVYSAAQIGAIAPGAGDPANGMLVAGADSSYPRALIDSRGIQWGPRAGFAYDVTGNGKTAIRGGFGMFYNRFFTEVFSNTLVGQPPLLNEPVINFGELKTFLSGAGLLYPQAVFSADRSGKLPTLMNFSLSVQRDIGWGTVVDIGYAGSLGRHLQWRRDINPIAMGANFDPRNFDPTLSGGRPLPPAFLRPIRGYNNITALEGASSSNYNSLQATARRRFLKNIQFGLAYTWSKALAFNDSDTEAISSLISPRVWSYGLADYDRTHILKINYIWDGPRFQGRPALTRHTLGNWSISGITAFVSGAPEAIGLSTTTAVDFTGSGSQSARVVLTGDPVLPKSERTFSRAFRTEVAKMPAIGTIGNAAITNFRGPGINNWDLAAFKNIPLYERLKMQFRWELYNAFNHTQFSAVDATARFDPATGQQVNSRMGQYTAARTPRTMQFALRLSF
jgi:hypothetical protein